MVESMNPERLPVDISIWASKTPDMDILNRNPLVQISDSEYVNQVQFVYDVSQQRDELLTNLTHLPESMYNVSWFLRDYTIEPYAAGEDFCDTQSEWQSIQNGDNPVRTVTLGPARNITTLRDGAVAVHADNPYQICLGVIGELLSLGVPKRQALADAYQENFACFGPPHIFGMVFNAMGRIGLLSFRNKWSHRIARPEEFYPEAIGGFLPQVFPEGSPMHCSKNAMHSAIYWTACYMICNIFDEHYILPNGETVKNELELWAGNMSDWRTAAGVHYMDDNSTMKPAAKALADKVLKEFMK